MRIDICGEQTARMTVLAPRAEESRIVRILSVSGRRITLGPGDRQLPTGALVRLSWEEYVVLGEVLSGSAGESVTLHIRHVLRTRDIEQIRRRWT